MSQPENNPEKENMQELPTLPNLVKSRENSTMKTPCKNFFQKFGNSFFKTSSNKKRWSTMENSLDKIMNKDPSKYCSLNFNELLDSDMKYKSPSKLCTLKMSFSPWQKMEERNLSIGQSPNISSGYKIHLKNENDAYLNRIVEPSISTLQARLLNAIDPPIYHDRNFYLQQSAQSKEPIYRKRVDGNSERLDSSLRKRKRKSNQQLKILKAEFEKSTDWSKDVISEVAKKTGLTESQVYKWCWDQKRKMEGEADRSDRDFDSVKGPTPSKCSISKNMYLQGYYNKRSKDCSNENTLRSLKKRKPFGVVNDQRINSDRKKVKHF